MIHRKNTSIFYLGMIALLAVKETRLSEKSLLGYEGNPKEKISSSILYGHSYRLMNPSLRIFLQMDSLSPFDKGGINARSVKGSQPINTLDPTGQSPTEEMEPGTVSICWGCVKWRFNRSDNQSQPPPYVEIEASTSGPVPHTSPITTPPQPITTPPGAHPIPLTEIHSNFAKATSSGPYRTEFKANAYVDELFTSEFYENFLFGDADRFTKPKPFSEENQNPEKMLHNAIQNLPVLDRYQDRLPKNISEAIQKSIEELQEYYPTLEGNQINIQKEVLPNFKQVRSHIRSADVLKENHVSLVENQLPLYVILQDLENYIIQKAGGDENTVVKMILPEGTEF